MDGCGIQGTPIPELLVTASDPVIKEVRREDSPVKEVVPPSPSKQPVFLKSNLHKKGKRFKGWHQRYFEIQGNHMYYYKNHTKTDCLGEIDLSLCIHCDVSDEATFGAPFEIQTTVRTHVMSARSDAERDQWIQAIKAQMGTESERKPAVNKPKRWKTFRNAFKIPQRHQKAPARSSKIIKRKTIMERLRLKRSNVPAPLQIRKEFNEQSLKHDRPLSDEIPQDTLAALEDVIPSRSLPATPLTRKRSDPTNLSSPESPVLTDPETPNSPAVMTVPVEVSPVNHAAEAETTFRKQQEASNKIEKFNERKFVWDEIREKLQSADVVGVSHDLVEEHQEWMIPSSGLEQLRAFLAVCD